MELLVRLANQAQDATSTKDQTQYLTELRDAVDRQLKRIDTNNANAPNHKHTHTNGRTAKEKQTNSEETLAHSPRLIDTADSPRLIDTAD